MFLALTAYGVEIPKALPTRQAALTWARQYGEVFPGSRVVQNTKRGFRTIWRHDVSVLLSGDGEG